jgi:hypothetical protein
MADRVIYSGTHGNKRGLDILTRRYREGCGFDAEQVTWQLQISVVLPDQKTSLATP